LTKTDKGYCRTIGYYCNAEGRRVPRRFWLGHDRSIALRKVKALSDAWEELAGERGEKVWADETIATALDAVSLVPTAATAEMVTAAPAAVAVFASRPFPLPVPPADVHTLPQALDEYAKWFGERNDISDYHRDGTRSRIGSLKLHVEAITAEQGGQIVRLADLPMSAIDMEWLSRIRNRVTSRPLTKHVYDTPKPISIDCVKGWLMTLGMAFEWFDRTARIGWAAPHRSWREQFTLTKHQEYALRTPEERDRQGKPKPTFTLDEIVSIHKNAVPLERLYLLMGVFLGWSQEGIRSLRRPHLVKVDGDLFIDRRRGKTGVEGYWWVCPELARLLVKAVGETPPNDDDLALLTEDGHPLVHGKTDSIRLTWERCLNHAPTGVRQLPFGRLRKFGGQVVENLGGHEVAQLFLSHRAVTVAAQHYVGRDVDVGVGRTPYERLHDVQRQMHQELRSKLWGT
jgi:hypothetical protein